MVAQETFVSNGAETTLSSSLAASATTISVVSTAAFPSVPFYIIVDPDIDAKREVILVDGSKTATTFTLSAAAQRGLDNTNDVDHLLGAKVICAPVAALWKDINDRVDGVYQPGGTDVAVADGGTGASTAADARVNLGLGAQDPFSARPAAGNQGATFFATDTDRWYRDNGTDWLPVGAEVTNAADYGVVGDGVVDDTAAIQAALDAAPGSIVLLPPDSVCRITVTLTVSAGTTLAGRGFASNAGSANYPSATILKDGAFDGIQVEGGASGLRDLLVDGATGNTGDGVYILGSRAVLENVTVTNQGQDGFRFGAKTAGTYNSNLPRCRNLIAISNGRHGAYVHDVNSTTLPNANAGLLEGFDARSNAGDGIKFESSIDWQVFGFHAASNTGYGWHLATGAEGVWLWAPYAESNTAGDGIADAGAVDNVVLGCRSNIASSTYVDNGSRNVMLGRDSNTARFTFLDRLDFRSVVVTDAAISGAWELRQNATDRSLELAVVDTGTAVVDVTLTHDGGGTPRLRLVGAAASTTTLVGRVDGEASDRLQLVADGRLFWGDGTSGVDTELGRIAAGVLGTAANDCFRTGRGATVNRPSASAVTMGAQWFDWDLKKPIWSDGTNWIDATGTVV